jgi:hypothetical protein
MAVGKLLIQLKIKKGIIKACEKRPVSKAIE